MFFFRASADQFSRIRWVGEKGCRSLSTVRDDSAFGINTRRSRGRVHGTFIP